MKITKLLKKPVFFAVFTTFGIANAQKCEVIYDVDFNNHNNITYTVAKAKEDFGKKVKPYTAGFYRGLPGPGASASLIEKTPHKAQIINGQLRAEFLKNDAGGKSGGFLFDPYFDGVDEAYLEYKVKFDKSFIWSAGGKLPGLGGSNVGTTSETVGRGSIPSGGSYDEKGNGFSARIMWRRNLKHTDAPYLMLYSYFAKKQDGKDRKDGDFGDNYRFFQGNKGSDGKPEGIKANVWYTIKQYVKLNTPGVSNGTVKMWVDGKLLFTNNKMRMRKAGKANLKINALIMHAYRGGSRSNTAWHSPKTEYAFFDDFRVWVGCENFPGSDSDNTNTGSSNTAPTVSINMPTNNSTYELGDTINIEASASDPDGNLEKVNFKINDDFFKTTSTRPFNTTFKPTATGTYKIEAIAFDKNGLKTIKAVSVTVKTANRKPIITINSPADASSYELGETIELNAEASDPDGNLEKVNYRINDAFFKTISVRPFTTNFKPTEAGTYKIVAIAFDKGGLTTEKTVNITIKTPNKKPIVNVISPVNESTYELGETINLKAEASDPDGNLEKVNYRINGKFFKTISEIPYNADFKPTEAGVYEIVAVAFDKDGLSTESIVNITVKAPNLEPTVEVTSPADGSVYELGETIDLSAIASDPEGNFEKINFKINDIYYRTSSTSPFNTTYTPKQVGTVVIAARAFDKEGLFKEKFVTVTIVESTLSTNDFISNHKKSKIKAYPSPAVSVLNVTGITQDTQVTIVSMNGVTVMQDVMSKNNSQIEVSGLAKGVYFLRIENGSNPKTITFIKN